MTTDNIVNILDKKNKDKENALEEKYAFKVVDDAIKTMVEDRQYALAMFYDIGNFLKRLWVDKPTVYGNGVYSEPEEGCYFTTFSKYTEGTLDHPLIYLHYGYETEVEITKSPIDDLEVWCKYTYDSETYIEVIEPVLNLMRKHQIGSWSISNLNGYPNGQATLKMVSGDFFINITFFIPQPLTTLPYRGKVL